MLHNPSFMLTTQEANFLAEELKTAKNPLFLYDDDADGLSSFLLLYRVHRQGKGVMVHAAPTVDLKLWRSVEEINPDKIFILDMPIVEQDFIDKAHRPIFWIDHHQPLELKNIHYYNPRIRDSAAYVPTTRMSFQVSQQEEDLWIATIGCLADYYFPDFIDRFAEKHPELLPKKVDLDHALYHQPIGLLVKLFFFLTKGKISDVNQAVKVLTRINSPEEIIKQTSSQGKFLWKRFEAINEKYELLLAEAKKQATPGKILLFQYNDNQLSLTNNLANELTVLYPKKIIIVCRKKDGDMKCSLRAKIRIVDHLQKALVGIEGYGGGHPNACGASIKEKDWERFLQNFKEELKNV